jgi:hypothetical protein
MALDETARPYAHVFFIIKADLDANRRHVSYRPGYVHSREHLPEQVALEGVRAGGLPRRGPACVFGDVLGGGARLAGVGGWRRHWGEGAPVARTGSSASHGSHSSEHAEPLHELRERLGAEHVPREQLAVLDLDAA